MSWDQKSKGYRKTETYKELNKIIEYTFVKPDYIDNIKDGVSFKWYIHRLHAHNLATENLKQLFPEYYYDRLQFKFLDHAGKEIAVKPLDWLERIFGKRELPWPYSLRMLVDLRGAK